MKICIVGFGFTMERREGVKNYVYEMSKGFTDSGFDILIVTLGKFDRTYQINGFRVIEISLGKSLFSFGAAFLKLKKKLSHVLNEEKPDILYDHFVLPGTSLFVTLPLIKKFKSCKFVKEVYNKSLMFTDLKKIFFPFELNYLLQEGIFRILLNNWIIDRFVYSHANYLVCHSSDIGAQLGDFRFKQIKLGIDSQKWDREIKVTKNNVVFNVAYLGHPSLKKGITVFIEVAILLLRRNLDISVHIALSKTAEGEKRYVNMATQLLKRFPDRVFLHGEIDPLKTFKISDLIVLPLLHDWGAISPPLSMLGAMVASSSVLVTRVCGVEDIIDDGINGFLINKTEQFNIVKRIEKMMVGENNSIGEKARKTALKYGWDFVFADYNKFLKSVVVN